MARTVEEDISPCHARMRVGGSDAAAKQAEAIRSACAVASTSTTRPAPASSAATASQCPSPNTRHTPPARPSSSFLRTAAERAVEYAAARWLSATSRNVCPPYKTRCSPISRGASAGGGVGGGSGALTCVHTWNQMRQSS